MSTGDEADVGGSPAAEADPLVRNGLGSPLCAGAPGGPSLSARSREDCETSAFVGSAAPTGDFGLDVHIDTGFLGVSSGLLLVIVQNLFITPVWMALVWAVHALVVMLEWCFALNLLEGGSVAGGIAGSLRELESTITVPWLVLVLAVGGVLCAYHGLVRRQVAESLAQALLALAMTAAGIWLAVDPVSTIGALGDWADRASVGTLAVTARGSPANAGGTLAEGFGTLFATAIEVPWCYLEFGDVDWCNSPARLDPGLRSAALALARSELEEAGCGSASRAHDCTSGSDSALAHSARLLRAARSNGAIFLALPPNGPARNAINDPSSLLRAICRNDNATGCRGRAAAQAEFRTDRGTWPRVGGLLLIAAGVIGLLLLLGFIALRLLGAAVASLLYLMLAPAVALAPALGEPGRSAFRKWATSLLAAVVSKLLYAFLLGVVLALLELLGHLQALGWWTRWLLLSAFWWGTFLRRHQLLQLVGSEHLPGRSPGGRSPLRRAGESLTAPIATYERVRAARERFRRRAPGQESVRITARLPGGVAKATDQRTPSDLVVGARAPEPLPTRSEPEPQASPPASSGHEHKHAPHGGVGQQPDSLGRTADLRDRAAAVGNARRVARLSSRIERREAEAASDANEPNRSPEGMPGEREARYQNFLDAQARRSTGGDRGGPGIGTRSYAALAGLAGYGRREFLQLDSAGRGAARQAIDRELASRHRDGLVSREGRRGDPAGASEPGEEFPLIPARFDPRRLEERHASAGPSESKVMKDAMELAAQRRRQLGGGKL